MSEFILTDDERELLIAYSEQIAAYQALKQQELNILIQPASERLAARRRLIELRLELPRGWLDSSEHCDLTSGQVIAPAEAS